MNESTLRAVELLNCAGSRMTTTSLDPSSSHRRRDRDRIAEAKEDGLGRRVCLLSLIPSLPEST